MVVANILRNHSRAFRYVNIILLRMCLNCFLCTDYKIQNPEVWNYLQSG